MLDQIKQNLAKGENIILVARAHPIILLVPLIPLIVGLYFLPEFSHILLILACVIYFIRQLLEYFFTFMVVTNKRTIGRTGIISAHEFDINLAKVEGINIGQGFFGSIFNYGNLLVRGTGSFVYGIKHIAKPHALKQAVNTATDKIQT